LDRAILSAIKSAFVKPSFEHEQMMKKRWKLGLDGAQG
jgi:hypothetical protein